MVKTCGLFREEDIEYANRLRPDFIGFILAPKGHRQVTPERAAELRSHLDPGIRAVGVFVREEPERIAKIAENGIIDVIQLHGGESPDYIRELRQLTDLPVMQAFRVETEEDLDRAVRSPADMILLDHGSGGTGETFDWNLLERKRPARPFFLAGGIGAENAPDAIRRLRPDGLDASSSLESAGKKDFVKMKAFVEAVRNTEEA